MTITVEQRDIGMIRRLAPVFASRRVERTLPTFSALTFVVQPSSERENGYKARGQTNPSSQLTSVFLNPLFMLVEQLCASGRARVLEIGLLPTISIDDEPLRSRLVIVEAMDEAQLLAPAFDSASFNVRREIHAEGKRSELADVRSIIARRVEQSIRKAAQPQVDDQRVARERLSQLVLVVLLGARQVADSNDADDLVHTANGDCTRILAAQRLCAWDAED